MGKTELRKTKGINIEHDQGGESVEPGVTQDSQKEMPIAADFSNIAYGTKRARPGEGFFTARSRTRTDSKAGKEAKCRDDNRHYGNKHNAKGRDRSHKLVHSRQGHPFLIKTNTRKGDTGKDGQGGDQFEDGINLRHFLNRKDLRDGTIERRTEKGRLQTHEKNHGQDTRPADKEQTCPSNNHSCDLNNLGSHYHFFLGKLICAPASGSRKENKGQGKEHGSPTLQLIKTQAHRQQHGGLFEVVIIKNAKAVGCGHGGKNQHISFGSCMVRLHDEMSHPLV